MTQEELKEAQAQAFEYMQKLNFIMKKIRLSESAMFETAPPSKSDNRKIVERVEFPNEGGTFTYFEGMKYPVKGFAEGESVERLDEAKKMLMRILKGFNGMSKFKFLFLIIFKKQIEEISKSLVVSFWEYIKKYRNKEERYCVTAKELYDVFKDIDIDIFYRDKIRDNICMLFEYDDAYRYRFQYIIEKLNKEEFKKNPIKELKRLFTILEETETEDSMKAKWRMVRKFIFLLRYTKYFKTIKEILLKIDNIKIKLDEADLYHARVKPTFKWPENIQPKQE